MECVLVDMRMQRAHLNAARGSSSLPLTGPAGAGLAPYRGCCDGAYKLSQLVWTRQCSTLAESSRSAQLSGPAAADASTIIPTPAAGCFFLIWTTTH